jgi:uncharacterized repeat protein (TIGR01451 family)
MVSASRAHGTRSTWVVGLSVVVAGAAIVMAAPATAGPSATSPGALAVTASALRSDVLPGETTLMAVAITNVGGSTLTGVTLTESLPAALTYLPGSAVAVRISASGFGSTLADGPRRGSAVADRRGAYSPGLLVSAFDGIDLAPGEGLRVTFTVTVSPALAPGVSTLTATSIATSGTSAVASDTQTLTILKQALDWAYGEGSN